MPTADVSTDDIQTAELAGWILYRAGRDYLHVRELSDGRAVFLMPMIAGNLRLAIGDPGSPFFDDGWCYQAEQTELAWRAAPGWDGEGEPEGWYRHPETGRRRPGGDAAKEYRYD